MDEEAPGPEEYGRFLEESSLLLSLLSGVSAASAASRQPRRAPAWAAQLQLDVLRQRGAAGVSCMWPLYVDGSTYRGRTRKIFFRNRSFCLCRMLKVPNTQKCVVETFIKSSLFLN